jgi:phage shock protein PspC (stress-responsive transcriptional regulator)
MNTTTVNPTSSCDRQFRAPLPHRAQVPGRAGAYRSPQAHPRPRADGVAAGLAEHFGVDVTIVRVAIVVLTVVGGAGIPLYLAGLLLIPDEGSDQSIAGSFIQSRQSRSR